MTVAIKDNEFTKSGDFSFSESDFRMIADLANAKYGLFLQPSKKALVYSRLAKRLRALKLQSFRDYCALLERPEGQQEHQHLLSALTTNVTHFFREMHHFDFLKSHLMPRLLEKCKAGESVRLWSSACSSGQEAYCMAATALSVDPNIARYDFRILATDIDPKMIISAKRARYPAEQVQAIPAEYRNVLIANGRSKDGHFEISAEVRSLVSFGELNLMEDWPMQRLFDVIFCRNAAIYFDKETQAKLWQRFESAMVDDGHLMIGHSERLSGPAMSALKSVGITTYQNVSSANLASPTSSIGEKE